MGARFDCGGHGSISCYFSNSEDTNILGVRKEFNVPSGSNWTPVKITVLFPEDIEDDVLGDTWRMRIVLAGKDSQFWSGHYGPKFARSCVRISLLRPEEVEQVGEKAVTYERLESSAVIVLIDSAHLPNLAMDNEDLGIDDWGSDDDDDE